MWIARGLAFVGINVAAVGLYCHAMVGKLEPLKHEPEKFVIQPLMLITAMASVSLYPLVRRESSRVVQAVLLYFGFVLISAVYGVYLWSTFPDGSPWAILVAMIGGHVYGWPPFLAVFTTHLLLGRWLFQGVARPIEASPGLHRGGQVPKPDEGSDIE